MELQAEWAACPKCQGLHYAGFPGKGVCPAGGAHEQTGSFAYAVDWAVPDGTANMQQNWAACPKCQGLHYAGFPGKGVCPAGGEHSHAGSFTYALAFDVPDSGDGQQDWRACPKCQGLFYGPFQGVCPAGGRHSTDQSFAYRVHCVGISNFTFDAGINTADRARLIDRHRFALSASRRCGNLSDQEKHDLGATYQRAIHHGFDNDPNDNGSATVGGSTISINFGRLFPYGDEEISQTLIHEMMHCAGYDHPDKRAVDQPGDNGQYFGTAPLRAELCIGGKQSDLAGPGCRIPAHERIQPPPILVPPA